MTNKPQKEWEYKGWIHKDDPRGLFEWYCKYFLGRRHEDDERQIKRWVALAGSNGRFRRRLMNEIIKQKKPQILEFFITIRIFQIQKN